MIEFLSQPWAWYVSGIAIAMVMFLLLWAGGNFGVSATLRSFCAMTGVGKRHDFFCFDWKKQIWNVVFALGAVIGGFIASQYLSGSDNLQLSASTISDLEKMNISFDGKALPVDIFNWESLLTLKGFLMMVVGGFLVGFGARWAGGCTSGHAISGLSNLQLPSLIAVIGFFIGGLAMTHLIFPLIF